MAFDWICVDLQHGLLDYQDLRYMLPAISTGNATPLVRVPWNEPYEIMKVLDAGAYGVIVPLVCTLRQPRVHPHAGVGWCSGHPFFFCTLHVGQESHLTPGLCWQPNRRRAPP